MEVQEAEEAGEMPQMQDQAIGCTMGKTPAQAREVLRQKIYNLQKSRKGLIEKLRDLEERVENLERIEFNGGRNALTRNRERNPFQ